MVGADPSFSEVHVVRALLEMHSGTIGRKRLVKVLGVGEGSVRTIIKRLSQDGLILSGKLGHSLTPAGRIRVDSLLVRIGKPQELDLRDLVPGIQSALVVRQASGKVGDGVSMRDTALRAGADGAVVLVHNGQLSFPGSGLRLEKYPMAMKALSALGAVSGDAVVIGFASSGSRAQDGALAVSLRLMD